MLANHREAASPGIEFRLIDTKWPLRSGGRRSKPDILQERHSNAFWNVRAFTNFKGAALELTENAYTIQLFTKKSTISSRRLHRPDRKSTLLKPFHHLVVTVAMGIPR